MEKRYQYCRSSSSLMSSYNDAHRSAINISFLFLHRRHFRGLFILFYVFYVSVCSCVGVQRRGFLGVLRLGSWICGLACNSVLNCFAAQYNIVWVAQGLDSRF